MKSFCVILFLCAYSLFDCKSQSNTSPFVGYRSSNVKSELPDLEGAQMLMEADANNRARISNALEKTYEEHMKIILSYIPDGAENGKAIAKKYIKLYHEEIGYYENQYAPFSKEAKQFVLLVKYDIEKELKEQEKDESNKEIIYNYFQIGYENYTKNKFEIAIMLFDEHIQKNAEDGEAYYYRGLSKIKMEDQLNGCSDLKTSRKHQFEKANESIKLYCN